MKVSKSLGSNGQVLKKSILSGLASLCIGFSNLANGSDDSIERFWPFEVENYSENSHGSYIPTIGKPLPERKLADTKFLRKYELSEEEADNLVLISDKNFKKHNGWYSRFHLNGPFLYHLHSSYFNNPMRMSKNELKEIVEREDLPEPSFEEISFTGYFHQSQYVAGKELNEDSIKDVPRILHTIKRYGSKEKLIEAIKADEQIDWRLTILNYSDICAFNLEDRVFVNFMFVCDSAPEKRLTMEYLKALEKYFHRNNLNFLDNDKEVEISEEEFNENSEGGREDLSYMRRKFEQLRPVSTFYDRMFEKHFGCWNL